MNDTAKKLAELEEKIPYKQSDMLVVQLHDEIVKFKDLVKQSKKNLTKGDLVNLLVAIIEFPVESTVALSQRLEDIYVSGCEAKRLLLHSNIQLLVEEGKASKGENNGEVQTGSGTLEEREQEN